MERESDNNVPFAIPTGRKMETVPRRRPQHNALLFVVLVACWTSPGGYGDSDTILGAAQAYSFEGKRAVVTGSSGGIGRGIALALAREGCRVMIHYHVRQSLAEETAELIRRDANSSSLAGIVQADFRDNSQIREMMNKIDDVWPDGYDILVNNAGIVSKQALEDDDDRTLTTWYDTMQVNLHAPRLLSHMSVPRMRKRNSGDGGVILQVSSIHGERSNEYVAPYSASKAALDMLTRSMAMEYAPYGIRSVGVAPGIVAVERTADVFADPDAVKAWTDRMPIPRLGRVEDVADVVVQMIRSEWVTGAVWQVDGGIMARSNLPDRARPTPPGAVCDKQD